MCTDILYEELEVFAKKIAPDLVEAMNDIKAPEDTNKHSGALEDITISKNVLTVFVPVNKSP